ncbi:hypothetical protein Misp01_65820 [Microtetraspora sp. NBRC 13810]|uniref:hypothetical protein n=1 Tax=Microtetraspora sp. NBRC 13810 TaxID=3030990 RepID=UPI0024A45E02|nr:hypothetical protein [Microtetraspora sp. NBRC 13810]GLW11454.1 hypothetical protein Misp01_65820 [Microtetraspora sp. NBRC 13810]
MSVRDVPAFAHVVPTAQERIEVQALLTEGEAPSSHGPGSERGAALVLLLLATLLSADPDRDEPVEDAFGGVVQNLACAALF